MKTILVTGGAGYIGSHTVVQLQEAGFAVVVLDNLANSHQDVLECIKTITDRKPEFIDADIRDREALQGIFQNHPIDAVIHFAGLKAVGECGDQPFTYYSNNVVGSTILLEEMNRAGVKTYVFSSSATVYGDPGYAQYREDTPLAPVNVYGRTKLMVEQILRDLKKSDPQWRIALLRYFNPVGAHSSGLIGENPKGIPNNLMPLIAQVAQGKRAKLLIYGDDYPTPDGTGIRDYIHVDDLATGHLAALKVLANQPELLTLNLGTGRPYSVLEILRAFEKVSGKKIAYEVSERRAGDLAQYYADPALAKVILGWQAQFDIERMCLDAWRWQERAGT